MSVFWTKPSMRRSGLSSRYITGRQLPDKAISVLDTSCARIAISQNSTPAPIEDARARCEQAAADGAFARRTTTGRRSRGKPVRSQRFPDANQHGIGNLGTPL
ncbi:hypothetical protein [Roseimaritima ulvae]|uniref:hypothetical protein n=1 Tax=Roseimaritima ulvae TaxID=980254 RepID=UPI0036F3CE6D